MATYRKPQVIFQSSLFGLYGFGRHFSKCSFHADKGILMKVSLINGIVMGGGAGVSIHGKFRVVTENTVLLSPSQTNSNIIGFRWA